LSKITTKARNKLPADKFAEPKDRKYPVDTRARAANAKSRASEMVNKGKLSQSSEAKIDAKANRILAKKK
jgi:hypothetical protein